MIAIKNHQRSFFSEDPSYVFALGRLNVTFDIVSICDSIYDL